MGSECHLSSFAINLLVQVYCYSTLERAELMEEKYQKVSNFKHHSVSNCMDRGMISRGISSGKASRNDFIKSSISLCDGQDSNGALSKPSTRSLFCGFNERGNKSSQSSFIFITTEFFCFVQTLVTLIVNMNVLEAFLYFKIFQSMNR